MKGNISRLSHRPAKRFSGVHQVQGGMVTDADLGEQADIARTRTDNLGHDAVCGGVPVKDGAVTISDGLPSLTEGTIYAEGVRGETDASGRFEGPTGYYDVQTDFPLAPPIDTSQDQIVYVDIWERMVSLLEDPDLADAGLHGVETSFRRRTMTQIKLAPLEDAEQIMAGEEQYPRIGTGSLTVAPVDPETIFDECDPCADVVSAEQTVANALFRIEVLHVAGPANTPSLITLGWSAENASAIAPATVNSEDFERAGAVYEYFSPVTESHLGVHANSDDAQRSVFADDLDAGPADQTAPEGGDWPFVRRWDGVAVFDMGTGDVEPVGGGTPPDLDGSIVTLTVDAFTATLNFTNRAVVAGDYWLVEMRRFSDTPIRAVQSLPIGILHNYCPLFRLSDGQPQEVTDAERRKLSFPFLADLPASHVALDNNCEKLFGDAENVQDALDNLCAIDASDIAFDPSDCRRLFDSTDNVQDALINLCRVDFGNERLLRLLHDWGVICGIVPTRDSRNNPVVRISAGHMLDRAGRLTQVDAVAVNLDELVEREQWLYSNFNAFANDFAEGGVCLALTADEEGRVRAMLVPKERAFQPDDPTFLSTLRECLEQRPVFTPTDDLTSRPPLERQPLDKVFYGAANPKLAAAQRLNGQEFQVASSYNDTLIAEYRAHVDDDEEIAFLDERLALIDREIPLENASGEALETRRLQRESLRYRAVQEDNQRRLQECICRALLPRCPVLGDPPHLVPIGCVEGFTRQGRIFLRRVCAYDCRKQAMSWRMMQYYISEMRGAFAQRLAEACCPPEQPPGTPGQDFLGPQVFTLANAVPREAAFNDAYFTGEIERSFSILTGQQPANDYRVAPDVGNLGLDQAEGLLRGNGVEVAETLDLADAEAITKLQQGSVGIDPQDLLFDEGKLKPGDRVALLVQDGVAVDYIKLEDGPSKPIFDTKKPEGDIRVPGKPGTVPTKELEDAGLATKALEDRLSAILTEAQKAEGDLAATAARRETLTAEVAASAQVLTTLETRRAELERQIGVANSSLGEALTQRTTLLGEVAQTKAELDAMATERQGLEAQLATARTDLKTLSDTQEETLAATRKERDELVVSIRRNTPVTSVVKDNEALTRALLTRGVTTQGQLADLPDTEIRAIATESRTNVRSVTAMRNSADRQIKATIR